MALSYLRFMPNRVAEAAGCANGGERIEIGTVREKLVLERGFPAFGHLCDLLTRPPCVADAPEVMRKGISCIRARAISQVLEGIKRKSECQQNNSFTDILTI